MTNAEARKELLYALRTSLRATRITRYRGPITRAFQWSLIKAIRALDKAMELERLGLRIYPGKKV